MKRLAFVLLLVAAVASPVLADQITINQTAYSWGVGGEFRATTTPSLSVEGYADETLDVGGIGFQTFCIEYSENFTPGATYDFTVSSAAVLGGSGGAVAGKHPLSQGTGWLYSQFATGQLSNYFNGTRQTNAGSLQSAIWWLEDEIPLSAPQDNPYLQLLLTQGGFSSLTAAKADGAYLYNVWALNISIPDTKIVRQDQLYYHVPDGGATLMLLGGALVGLAALRRKYSR